MLVASCVLRSSPPRLSPSCTCSLFTTPRSSATSPAIVIPPRVERGPTAVLEALAATVGRDDTAPHYKFHDDPWLTPYKSLAKRDFSLAKEAGRKAARYVLNKHPDLFHHNRIYAEPPITAFQPRAAYNQDNVTVELLANLVSTLQVADAIAVHQLLKEKRKEVGAALRQELLELVAFHNEEEAEEEGGEARGALKAAPPRWKQGGVAEQLYSEGGAASEEGRLALLLGYARFGGRKGAQQMWEECRVNQDTLPLEAFHARLASLPAEGVERCMEEVREVLGEVRSRGLAPTTATLVGALRAVAESSGAAGRPDACRAALDLVAELREHVALSPGVYTILLDIFVDLKSPRKSGILVDVLEVVEGQELWPAATLEDFHFLPRAMQVAHATNRPDLAWRINQLMLTGSNASLLSDLQLENSYYNFFLQNILQNDGWEAAIELYHRACPHLWAPGGQFYRNLLSALHAHGATNHLAKVYDDLMLCDMGGSNKETCNELNHQVVQVLERNPPKDSEFQGLQEVWRDIATRVFNNLEQHKDNLRFSLRFNLVAARICELAITVQLREGGWTEAARVFRFCLEHSTVIPGQLNDEVLSAVAAAAVAEGEVEAALEVVQYAVTMASPAAVAIATTVTSSLALSSGQKELVNKLLAAEPQWKPL